MDDEQQKPQAKKPKGIVGKRLGPKGVVATALLEGGASHRTVQKLTGIAAATSVALKRQGLQKLIPPEHAEQIRRGLRNQFAVVDQQILTSVDKKKIDVAGLGETLRAAGIAADRAGIGPVSHVEVYRTSITKYEKSPDGPPSGTPKDRV